MIDTWEEFVKALRDGRAGHASEWLETARNRWKLLAILDSDGTKAQQGWCERCAATLSDAERIRNGILCDQCEGAEHGWG